MLKRAFVLAIVGLLVSVTAALAGNSPSLGFVGSPTGDFGQVANGSSATLTYTIQNGGGAASGALTVSVAGASDFSVSSDTCTAASVGPRKICSIAITYAPTTDGANDTATLTVSSKKPAAAAALPLSGSTAAATGCTPDKAQNVICVDVHARLATADGHPDQIAVLGGFALNTITGEVNGTATYFLQDLNSVTIEQGTITFAGIGFSLFTDLNGNPVDPTDAAQFDISADGTTSNGEPFNFTVEAFTDDPFGETSDTAAVLGSGTSSLEFGNFGWKTEMGYRT